MISEDRLGIDHKPSLIGRNLMFKILKETDEENEKYD